ncbi:unnamed protein product [Brachionus calyciflorus]|uniref:Uncharacterized protein n=1 Tax=Brachionus calyciflorus TaxID=104777 RepID=A0A813W071_9BILA|nr:unnamed protein product [Brachionus calyciflorus]
MNDGDLETEDTESDDESEGEIGDKEDDKSFDVTMRDYCQQSSKEQLSQMKIDNNPIKAIAILIEKNSYENLKFSEEADKIILVFSSPAQLEELSKASHWYADETFKSAAKNFYQSYILHAYINNYMIPCAYAFMNRRRQQEIMRTMKKVRIGSICCLAIVPLDYVNTLFEKLLASKPYIPNADIFLNYVVDYYFEGNFDVSLWNHFTKNTLRKNNNLESYKYRLNKQRSVARPDIFSAINKLKEDDASLSITELFKETRLPQQINFKLSTTQFIRIKSKCSS